MSALVLYIDYIRGCGQIITCARNGQTDKITYPLPLLLREPLSSRRLQELEAQYFIAPFQRLQQISEEECRAPWVYQHSLVNAVTYESS